MDLTETAHAAPSTDDGELEAVRLTGSIGAEIRGVTLSGDMSEATVAAVRRALLKHKVIFFRDQHQLDDDQQEAFAERMGELMRFPTHDASAGSRSLLDLQPESGYLTTIWHTDTTFMASYPQASILRAITMPSVGGDTMWANTAAAYRDLPAPLKALVADLTCIHRNTQDMQERYGELGPDRLPKAGTRPSNVFESEHPVVSIHPETGERCILLGQQFTRRFVGLTVEDSQRLIGVLQDHVTRPEHTVRWRWRAGDVAIWDNRATQHRVVADYGQEIRHLRRATVRGGPAVGLNGFRSRQTQGEATAGTVAPATMG